MQMGLRGQPSFTETVAVAGVEASPLRGSPRMKEGVWLSHSCFAAQWEWNIALPALSSKKERLGWPRCRKCGFLCLVLKFTHIV